MAEEAVVCPSRQDEVIVWERATLRGDHPLAFHIHPGHLVHHDGEVRVLREHGACGGGDIRARERSSRHLVEERLE